MNMSSNFKPRVKKCQVKYQKPTQPLYRPPSARVESSTHEWTEPPHSSNLPIQSSYLADSRFQPAQCISFGNVVTNPFPIKGVLKRSKSFGNNNRNSNEFDSTHLLDETATGRFLLSMEGMSWEDLTLIKQALDKDCCMTLSMTQLMQVIRILCNKVLEKPPNAKMIAQVCMEIHDKQQQKATNLTEHKYLFLESLSNCLREWFNERDKLRFTTGGARRWIGYILFLMEMYLNLKTIQLNKTNHSAYSGLPMNDMSDESDDNYSNIDNQSVDEEVSRAFSSSEPISETDDLITNSSARTDNDYLTYNTPLNIEYKIFNSVLCKQQKQFSNLLLDSFQVILSNPNSTPAEIECMQTVFHKCGKYLEEDNQHRIKSLVFTIRDTLLNCTNPNQFINASNSSNNSSINKNLLEIIELAASNWNFCQSQQIYYFPYTKMD